MPPPINQTTNEFLAGLSRADIHPNTIKQATKRVKLLIGDFERSDENRTEGGRAVKKGPRKRVRTTLRHLIRAARDAWSGDRSSESRKARELLRALRTFKDFEAMEEKARDFAGFRWKERRRQNQHRIREQAPIITIGTSLVLRQLATVDDLRSVSLTLQLCAHNPDWGYLEALRDRSQDFWAIQRGDDPIALIAVDRDEKKVSEADGFDHDSIGLSRCVMLEVLRRIRASADDCKAFSSVGAYSLFLTDPVPDPRNIQFDNSIYRCVGRGRRGYHKSGRRSLVSIPLGCRRRRMGRRLRQRHRTRKTRRSPLLLPKSRGGSTWASLGAGERAKSCNSAAPSAAAASARATLSRAP